MGLFGRFKKLDSSLQRGLDNGFARVFGGEVVPTEIDEVLKQYAEESVMTDAQGQRLAPSYFQVLVSTRDYASLTESRPRLAEEMGDRLSRFIRNQGWRTNEPVTVHLSAHDGLHSGQMRADARFDVPHTDNPSAVNVAIGEDAAGSSGATPHRNPDGGYEDSYPRAAAEDGHPEWPSSHPGERSLMSQDYDAPSANADAPSEANAPAPGRSLGDLISPTEAPETSRHRGGAAAGTNAVGTAGAGAVHRAAPDFARNQWADSSGSGEPAETSVPSEPSVPAGSTGSAAAQHPEHRPSFPSPAPSPAPSPKPVPEQPHGDQERPAREQQEQGESAVHHGQDGQNQQPGNGFERPVSYPGTEIIVQTTPSPVRGGVGAEGGERELKVTLTLRDGSDRTYELRKGSNIIGRGNGVDLRIPDTGVSRQHADITWDGYDAVLTDLQSTNGTSVNGTSIENWLLASGDVISLGHSEIGVEFH